MSGTCPYLRKINAYHDHELAPQAHREGEAHIAVCEQCAAELRELEKISGLLRGSEVPEIPEEIIALLHTVIVQERVVMRISKIFTSVAAAIIVVCGLWLWSLNGSEPAFAAEPWEQTAITLSLGAVEDEPQQLARWIVEDLSLENGHEQD